MEKEISKDTTTVAIYKETHKKLRILAALKDVSIKQVLKELVAKAKEEEKRA
jgi:hypothetical protein